MADWKDHLRPKERDQLDAIEAQAAEGVKTRRMIYDRCRRRAERAARKGEAQP